MIFGGKSVISFNAVSTLLDKVCRVTVTVSDINSKRTSSAFTDISIIADKVSQVSISLPANQSMQSISTLQNTLLIGSLYLEQICTAIWAVDDLQIDLSAISLSPVSRNLIYGSNYIFQLVIGSNTLPERTTLVFSLSCGNSRASITLTTNGRPLPGEFNISPNVGLELTTLFQLSASYWSDPDLPLFYQIGFVSQSSLVRLIILSASELTYDTTTLPSGSSSSSYLVNCTLEVIDSLQASSSVINTIKVKPINDTQQQFIIKQLISSQTSTVDQSKKVIAIGSTVLNSVNCDNAANCSVIGRNRCLKTPNTCGTCLAGYIGDSGDSNSPCMSREQQFDSNSNISCSKLLTCPTVWLRCDLDSNNCIPKSKVCPNSCSGEGSCVYSNINTGKPVATCFVNDFTCEAICHCFHQFTGISCEINPKSLVFRQATRSRLINMLSNVTRTDNINSQSIISWTNSLSALSQNPFEIKVQDVAMSQIIANDIVNNAIALNYQTIDDLEGVLQSLNAIYPVTVFNYILSTDTIANNSLNHHYNNRTSSEILNTLSLFNNLILNGMVEGQNSSRIVYSNFRMINKVARFVENVNIRVETPLSDIEKIYLSASNLSHVTIKPKRNISSGTVKVSLISTFAKTSSLKCFSILSNPLHLKVYETSYISADSTSQYPVSPLQNMRFYLPNIQSYPSYIGSGYNFTTKCTGKQDFRIFHYTCSNSQHPIVHSCNGTKVTIVSTCPQPVVSCQLINDTLSTGHNNCTVSKVTSSTVVCDCYSTVLGRRLQTIETGQDKVSLVSAVSYSASDVVTIFETTKNISLTDLFRTPLTVIIMYIVFGCVFILGLVWFYCKELIIKSIFSATRSPINRNRRNAVPIISLGDGMLKQQLISHINCIMPQVFRLDKSPLQRLQEEVLRHHNLFLLFSPDEVGVKDATKIVSWVRLFTIQNLLMFLMALFFEIQNPSGILLYYTRYNVYENPLDDNLCPTYLDKKSCLQRKLVFDSKQSYCQWSSVNPSLPAPACSYSDPTITAGFIFVSFIVIFLVTELVSFPLDVLIDILSIPSWNARELLENNLSYTDNVNETGKEKRIKLFTMETTDHATRDIAKVLTHTILNKSQLLKNRRQRNCRNLLNHLKFDNSIRDLIIDHYSNAEVSNSIFKGKVTLDHGEFPRLILYQYEVLKRLELESLVGIYESYWDIQPIPSPLPLIGEDMKGVTYQVSEKMQNALANHLMSVNSRVECISHKYRNSEGFNEVDLFYRFILDLLGQSQD